jgi:DNA-binding LacI/PurR family transcriptional regulator
MSPRSTADSPSPPPERPVTQEDIARALGIARSTVSRALRGNLRIPAAHRQAIWAKAREMGYRPNPMATALSFQRQSRDRKVFQSTLAWINAWCDPAELRSYRLFDLYWRGAKKAAERLGFRLEEFRVDAAMPLDRLGEILKARGICGVMMPPVGDCPFDWNRFNWEDFSTVRLYRGEEHEAALHCVVSDQMHNTLLAFDRARAAGYQRVGFVGSRWRTRFFGAGYYWAQHSIPNREAQIRNTLPTPLPPLLFAKTDPPFEETNRRSFLKWLKQCKPDAILTEAPGVPEWLPQAGIHAPEEIGLATLNRHDSPLSAGIDQNPEEIGRVAALALASLINDNDRGIPPIHREIVIKGSWVDGASLPNAGNRSRLSSAPKSIER